MSRNAKGESWWFSPRKGVRVGKGLSDSPQGARQRSALVGHSRVLSLRSTEGRVYATLALSMLVLGAVALLYHQRISP